MRINVRTTGLLGRYLPPGSASNRAQLEVSDGATPFDVIRHLGMPEDGAYLIALNGEVVPEAKRTEISLQADDKLSIMSPLKGG